MLKLNDLLPVYCCSDLDSCIGSYLYFCICFCLCFFYYEKTHNS